MTGEINPIDAIFSELDEFEIRLRESDGRLQFYPRDRLSPELLARLRAFKPTVILRYRVRCELDRLQRHDSDRAGRLREDWLERLAICQVNGGTAEACELVAYESLMDALAASAF